MGREVRKVAPDWEHPKPNGIYEPLYPGAWGRLENQEDGEKVITPDQCMPDWPDDAATHYMMYEDTTEGTPISPAFATPEELARWLTDNNASAFARQTATYEGWLRVAKGGFAPSMVMTIPEDGSPGTMQSGVDALRNEKG